MNSSGTHDHNPDGGDGITQGRVQSPVSVQRYDNFFTLMSTGSRKLHTTHTN